MGTRSKYVNWRWCVDPAPGSTALLGGQYVDLAEYKLRPDLLLFFIIYLFIYLFFFSLQQYQNDMNI